MVPTNCKVQRQEAELVIEKYKRFEKFYFAKRGVYIYIHESLECREMTGTDGDKNAWCEAKLTRNDKLLIGCFYRSPNSNVTSDAKINDTLKKATNLCFAHVLIFGYLDEPSLNWRENISPPDGKYPCTIFSSKTNVNFTFGVIIISKKTKRERRE